MDGDLAGKIVDFVLNDKPLHEILQVIAALVTALCGMALFLSSNPKAGASRWLAEDPSKRACELWFLGYGAFWICCFGVIIAFQLYNSFEAVHYMVVCGGLASPLLLQPVLFPGLTKDAGKPLLQRYSFKANAWIFIFGFIGNYWYTHYFYNVLKASYTFKSWDVNGVPIPMIFATHFYFTFYHTLSNMALRKATTSYAPGTIRLMYKALLIFTMSYVTAFMEAATISGFHCYSFEDRHMAWVMGSAFYGIYFIVSFPMFFRLDERSDSEPLFTTFQAVVESLASGMAVLCMLDFVRVALGMCLSFSV